VIPPYSAAFRDTASAGSVVPLYRTHGESNDEFPELLN
jgi:hypothetical protein